MKTFIIKGTPKRFVIFYCFLLNMCYTLGQSQLGSTIYGDAAFDRLGRSVDISSDGTRIVLGAEGNDVNCEGCGQVRIYEYIDDDWELLGQEIYGSFEHVGVGATVKISGDGNTIACGGFLDSPEVVSVYRFDGQAWQKLGEDLFGDQADDGFGLSTSMSYDGNSIIIGARYDDEVASWSGKVKVYEYDGNDWVIKGQVFRGTNSSDRLGRSCAMSSSGDTIAFSIEGYDGVIDDIGRVVSYAYLNGSWNRFGSYIDGENYQDFFGSTISMSNNGTVLASGSRTAGYANVYELINGDWEQRGQKIKNGVGPNNYTWNMDISPDGNSIAVADPAYDNLRGLTHIYDYFNGTWIRVGTEIIGMNEGDVSGAVALSQEGARLVWGSQRSNVNGEDVGLVEVLDLTALSTTRDHVMQSINIYPNPAKNALYVDNGQQSNSHYKIYDAYGRTRMKGIIRNGQIILKELESGQYQLHLESGPRSSFIVQAD